MNGSTTAPPTRTSSQTCCARTTWSATTPSRGASCWQKSARKLQRRATTTQRSIGMVTMRIRGCVSVLTGKEGFETISQSHFLPSLCRDIAGRCKRLAVAVLNSCEGANEVRLLLKEEAAAKKFFSHVFLYRDTIQFIYEHQWKYA